MLAAGEGGGCDARRRGEEAVEAVEDDIVEATGLSGSSGDSSRDLIALLSLA